MPLWRPGLDALGYRPRQGQSPSALHLQWERGTEQRMDITPDERFATVERVRDALARDDDGMVIEALLDIIRWEAKRYDGNEPLFAIRTAISGQPLEEGLQRQRVWRAIFGTPRKEAPPGEWVECLSCSRWSVRHPDSDRTLTDHHVQLLAKQNGG